MSRPQEPGAPLLVSLLLYLDADWPRDWGAETHCLDVPSDSGLIVRPKVTECTCASALVLLNAV